MQAERIAFGEFELDATNFELRRGATPIKLERIPMELLILLARNHGRLVGREEAIETIWGKDCFLEADSAINTAIRKLRRALGDQARESHFIETVSGKGYRFVAARANRSTPADAKALYAKGLHFWNRKTPESYVQAIQLYQKSIDIDPEYAMPYLGLAKTWILFGIHGLQLPGDVYPRARATLTKALELDSGLAEGYAAMGDVVKGYDWDWAGAESYYLRALTLDPRCGIAHQWYANLLSITERHDEALRHALEARALDPLSVGAAGFVGFTYLRARRFREALRESEGALTLEPDAPIANWFLGQALLALERFREAAIVFGNAVEASHGASMYLSALGYSLAGAGAAERAEEIFAQLQGRAQDRYVSPLDLATVAVGLGRLDEAAEYMEAAVEQRVMRLTELRMPTFDRLRDSERFQRVLAKVGIGVR